MHLLVLSAFRRLFGLTMMSLSIPVSMHLLVLSAFRLANGLRAAPSFGGLNAPFGAQCFPTGLRMAFRRALLKGSQCTFWCSVLSDTALHSVGAPPRLLSQCTFWCSVLSDRKKTTSCGPLVQSLNAPFGAQCFPT